MIAPASRASKHAFHSQRQGNSDRIVRSHLQTVEGQKVLIVDKADELAAPLNGAFDLLPPFHGTLHDTVPNEGDIGGII